MNHKLHPHLNQLVRSATLAINERSAEMAADGQTIYHFGFGQSPFPVPDSIVSALQENAYRKNYLPVEGLFELREAVAAYHNDVDQIHIEPEGVLVSPGSKELIFTLQMAIKGSTLIPAPCWVSYVPQANLVQRDNQYIQTRFEDNWRLLPDQLDFAVKQTSGPHLLILNYPGNPDGGTYSAEELKALANVARKNNVLILSDEIYGRLYHKGEHVSIARFYPEGTIVSSSLSKWCAAGGWRLGHFAFPKELFWLKEALASITSDTYSCVAAPIQYAGLQAYNDKDTVGEYLFHCRRILSTIGNFCASTLLEAGVNIQSPSGAFYLFPDFESFRISLSEKGIHDSAAMCEQLLQDTRVVLLPGTAFGRPAEELNARIAYVNFDGGKALQTSREISMEQNLTMHDLGDNVINVKYGIEKLIDWLKE
ncbi:MAG: aspartate aminotransferase [Candidatus Marinimicrobia bacterium]|nr:aspartate aminotransferase [Candidatus Neomarinimicrobiota bacterium]